MENLREQNMDSHHQEDIYLIKLNFERTAAAWSPPNKK